MRCREFPKGYTSWCGKTYRTDTEATLEILSRNAPEEQENDAYWNAIDLLKEWGFKLKYPDNNYWEEYGKTYKKLHESITAKCGQLNKGWVSLDESGKRIGTAYWETEDKDMCIRWAIADTLIANSRLNTTRYEKAYSEKERGTP